MASPVAQALQLYAVVTPGLEPFTRRELEGLGLAIVESEPGGVAFHGSLDDLARANLWLRTASRILVRVIGFHARALGELERKTATIPWDSWLARGVPVKLRVSSRKSRLYHQKAVAERIGRTLQAAGWSLAAGGSEQHLDAESESPDEQLVVVRLYRDDCSISLDSSGELLHRRGYRLASGKAPLRETLAAALIMASGWDGSTPLIDPFAGSGTIPIEAALLARRIPPGLRRRFAFQRWPMWQAERWKDLIQTAERQTLARAAAPILGSDRDAGAIRSAEENAKRAGVGGDVAFRRAAVSAIEPPPGPGMVVSNPPYGVRVGQQGELRDLYARLGQVARKLLPSWRMTLLVPTPALERQTGLKWREEFQATNGGLWVRGVSTTVPGGPPPGNK